VIAAGSSHGTDAAGPGVEVYSGEELMPDYGPVLGRGDAMWRTLSVARNDLVVYVHVEVPAFEPHFVCGVLRPLLSFPRVRFAKGAYEEYPLWGAQDEAKRKVDKALAELMARPLINLHYLELSRFLQPLSGELATPCELLCTALYFTGYATEMTIMIDLLHKVRLDAMAGPTVTLNSSSTMSWPDYRHLQESWTFAISVLYQRGLCSGP
jgi:glucosyl-3-phosphoglycerate synthase